LPNIAGCGFGAGKRQLQRHNVAETFGRKSAAVADEMDEDLGAR